MANSNRKPHAPFVPVWFRVALLVLACWVCAFAGPISVLIIPLLAYFILVSVSSRSWLPISAGLLLNPLTVFALSGVADYLGGAPKLRFVGLPSAESFNIDRKTRCFRSGGGCLISGNEWVWMAPHNMALRTMFMILGPPSKSYDGPYPTKGQAKMLLQKTGECSADDLTSGRLKLDGETWALSREEWESLRNGMICFYDLIFEDEEPPTQIKVTSFQKRCVIIGFSQQGMNDGPVAEEDKNCMILLDRKNNRYFASYGFSRSCIRLRGLDYAQGPKD